MADCATNDNCEDVLYPEPLVPAPLPMPSEGGGHEFVSQLPAVGTPGVEYLVMDDPTDCSTFKGSYVYNPQCGGWVQTSGGGGGSAASDNYTFEETTTGWVAKKNGKVIFTYNDERITQNASDISDIVADIYNNYLVNRIAVCPDGPLTLTVDDTDPKAKKLVICLDGELGDRSDGAYEIKGELSTFLSTTLTGTSTVNTANVPSLNPDDIVLGETYLYDHQGTMGVVTDYDPTTGNMTVKTMTTSPGQRTGIRLGSVDVKADLPANQAAAEAKGWLTPDQGDFAYVMDDNGKIAEYFIKQVNPDGTLDWEFSHYINAGNYVLDIYLNNGTMIPKNTDGSVTLPNFVLYIELADGTTLPVDPNGRVKLPDFETDVPIKGIRLKDGTMLVPDANGIVTLPEIPKPFNDYKININIKEWANPFVDIDTIKDLPLDAITGITKDGAAITTANFLAEVQPERDIIFIVGYDDGYIPSDDPNAEGQQGDPFATQEAICFFKGDDTNNLKLRVLAVPRGGGSGAGNKQVPEYTRDLHNGDHIGFLELITKDDILYRAKQDVTLTGNWTIDQQYFELVNTVYKDVFYTHNSVGDKLGFAYGRLAEDKNWQMAVGLVPFVAKPGNTIDQPSVGLFTIPAGATVEVTVDIGLYGTNGTASSPNAEWGVFVEGQQTNISNSILKIDPYGNTNTTHQWALNGSGTGIFTNTSGTSVNIGLYVTSVQQAGQIFGNTSDIVIHEIGKEIDPVEYMTNMGDKDQDVPVGTVISYMGEKAPEHYLLCDGHEYAVGDYPELEAWMVDEYGTVNKFGGTPGNTWKVPDLRGEFIRGTGTNGHANQGNGADVGEHQDSTYLSGQVAFGASNAQNTMYAMSGSQPWATSNNWDRSETEVFSGTLARTIATPTAGRQSSGTLRPTNTSVNFCIKYEKTHRLVINQAGSQADTSTAEAMMKPHTWPVGVVQNFGDNTFGVRMKGNTGATNNSSFLITGTTGASHLISMGGEVNKAGTTGNNWYGITGAYMWNGTTTSQRANDFLTAQTGNGIHFYWQFWDAGNIARAYDIWFIWHN